jgi:hypothetical protein
MLLLKLWGIQVNGRKEYYLITILNRKQETEKMGSGIKIYLLPGYQDLKDNNISAESRRNFYHKNNFKRTAESRYWSN